MTTLFYTQDSNFTYEATYNTINNNRNECLSDIDSRIRLGRPSFIHGSPQEFPVIMVQTNADSVRAEVRNPAQSRLKADPLLCI